MFSNETVSSPASGTDPSVAATHRGRRPWLLGGGIDGNEQLTAMTGVILLVLLAVLGVTIIRIGQLMWLHLFLGLLLIGPVALKIASTGYRLTRYYTRDAIYRSKGPPMLLLRAAGPVVVLSTVTVFATGVVLLFIGPRNRATTLLLHKVSFFVWLAFMAMHVLAHLPSMGRSLQAVRMGAERSGHRIAPSASGAAGRWIAVSGMIVAGAVLALLLLPHFSAWTAPGALPHHHHDG